MYIAKITQNYPDIAFQEIQELFEDVTLLTPTHVFFTTQNPSFFSRLAFTNTIYQIISTDYQPIQLPSTEYKIEFEKKSPINKERAFEYIYYAMPEPIINLNKPKDIFYFFTATAQEKQILYCTKQIYTNQKTFLERKPQLRIAKHPSSIDPRLARAMVNLAGKKAHAIYDPFCGTGGILLEAFDCQLQTIGSDIDPHMIEKSQQNCKQFHANVTLFTGDALKQTTQSDAIVTDLPYGKNTRILDNIQHLYEQFLKREYEKTNRIVLCTPSFIPTQKIIERTQWNISFKSQFYVHKNLNRVIYLLTK
ncbi:MAG: TRM11 family SAM-dependent methyltransferase [Candidatus Woesearchaeota archaeon]